MEVLALNGEERQNELEHFFRLYREFLEIETIVSFVKGRDYNIVKCFYKLFLSISQEEVKKEEVEKDKNSLKYLLKQYKAENRDIQEAPIFSNCSTYIPPIANSLNKGAKISQAFLLLTEAIRQYQQWRKSLSKEAIQAIYLKNLQDRQKYYFKITQENLNRYLTKEYTSTDNYILRQSLIEFYNGISHLNAAYLGRENKINVDRAASHFMRGALDSYKAIIKDFCFLAGNEPLEKIIDGIRSIRQCECKTIGEDEERNKQELYIKYKNFTRKIIESHKRTLSL